MVLKCKFYKLSKFHVLQVSYFKHFLMPNYPQSILEYQVSEME